MLESRWPRGPIVFLALLLPVLYLLNPYIRDAVRTMRSAAGYPLSRGRAPSATGAYVRLQLDELAGKYWRRVAGADTGQKPWVNGHDEFAAAWRAEMLRDLQGLPTGVFVQRFPLPGFRGHRPSTPGRNIIVTVPGAAHPARAVVIGTHYDGEPFSKGSAYDDTSGAAIMLGLARSLGALWRQQGLPQLTVEFILFDGEEQGLIGSSHYLASIRERALLPRPVMMIDEEQSGAGYPARAFGSVSGAVMSGFATTTAITPVVRRLFGLVKSPDRAALKLMTRRLLQDRASAFRRLDRAYPTIRLRDGPIRPFTTAARSNLIVGPNPVCCSDNAAFEALGLPTVTFSGDFRYYYSARPDWSFPYDQPEDTPAALVCDTGGSPRAGASLEAALALPALMSYQVVNQYAPPGDYRSGLAVLGDTAVAGRSTSFSAAASAPVRWSFGDGSTATGPSVAHRYRRPARFQLRVRSSGRVFAETVWVRATPPKPKLWKRVIAPPPLIPWHPAALANVPGCP